MKKPSGQNAGRILIVEDESVHRELLASYLRKEHYSVSEAENGNQAEELLYDREFDVVLLDIMLPGIDGLTLTRQIRSNSDIGIILVTNKTDDIDRIVGLELGADDYITKPFNPRELLARTKNIYRRVHTIKQLQKVKQQMSIKKEIVFGEWSLNVGRRIITNKQQQTHLTANEFTLLTTFISNAGNVMTRDYLMDKMRSREWCPTDRSIDVLVARLRRKLGDDSSKPSYIITEHGSGYIFIAEILST